MLRRILLLQALALERTQFGFELWKDEERQPLSPPGVVERGPSQQQHELYNLLGPLGVGDFLLKEPVKYPTTTICVLIEYTWTFHRRAFWLPVLTTDHHTPCVPFANLPCAH